MPTQYIDFRQWLQYDLSYEESDFINSIESFISGINLWSEFERALGSIQTKDYLQHLIQENIKQQNENNKIVTATDICDAIQNYCKINYDYLIYSFIFWTRTIETIGVKTVYKELYAEDHWFVTFNYTNTLEQLYGIPQDKILHIHGNIKTDPYRIIVGHNHDYQHDRKVIQDILYSQFIFDGDEVIDQMIEFLNYTYKNTNEIIYENYDYFIELKNAGIEKIIVMGHSFGEIDWSYFDYIHHICPDAQWELSFYKSPEDIIAADKMNKNLRLKAVFTQIDDKRR